MAKQRDATRVLVVGLGGLGCPATMELVDAGIGHLALMDDDRVAVSNLHRQVLYSTGDAGRLKVEAAREALCARRPDLEVTTMPYRLTAANALESVRDFDLVIDGTDGFGAKFLINDACVLAGVPFIHAGAIRWSGQVLAVPRGAPCLRCLFEGPPPPPAGGSEASCREQGVVGPLVGVVGALEARRGLAILDGRCAGGDLIVCDGLAGSLRRLRFVRDPACPSCGESPRRELRASDYLPGACAADARGGAA